MKLMYLVVTKIYWLHDEKGHIGMTSFQQEDDNVTEILRGQTRYMAEKWTSNGLYCPMTRIKLEEGVLR
jgi:hypothetical protein